MKVSSQKTMMDGIKVGLLGAALVLTVGMVRLYAMEDEPGANLPAPSDPGAPREPMGGITPGHMEPANTEHGENSTTYKDRGGHTIETEVYVRGTKKVAGLTRYNWYYPEGDMGSVTTYQFSPNGDIITTVTTYDGHGKQRTQESWTTNSSGMVSNSSSAMYPNGAKNTDPTIENLRDQNAVAEHSSLAPTGGGDYHASLVDDYLNDIKTTPSGWSASIFGGADVNQGYSSNYLHSSNASGSSTSYDQGENSPLGSIGGIEVEYRTEPMVFDYFSDDYWGCDDDKFWHYDPFDGDWYYNEDEPPRIYDPKTDTYHERPLLGLNRLVDLLEKYPPPVQFAVDVQTSYNGTELKQSFGDFWSRTNQDNFSMMVNGKMYFDVTPQIRPYMLFGAGFSYLNASTQLTFTDGTTNIGTADAFVPAIQGGVGLEYGINKDFSVYGQYTHVVEFGSTLNYTAGMTNYSQKLGDISHDQFEVGLRYNIGFGKP